MPRFARAATIVALIAAFTSLSLTMDWCAVSCDTTRAAGAASPTCHHSASPGPRIGRPLRPCGHDHHTVADVVTLRTVASQTSAPAAAIALPRYALLHNIAGVVNRAGPEIESLLHKDLFAISPILRI